MELDYIEQDKFNEQSFFAYLRITSLKNQRDQELLSVQKIAMDKFFSKFSIPSKNIVYHVEVGSAEDGVGQEKLLEYLELCNSSGRGFQNLIIWSIDRLCRNGLILEGIMLHLEKMSSTIICLKDDVIYFQHHNNFIDWEKHGFFSLTKENLIQNVWLKEQEIKSAKDRIYAGRLKRTALGLDFRHLPMGITFMGDYRNNSIAFDERDYRIINVILFAFRNEPSLESLVGLMDNSINGPLLPDIQLIKNNLEMLDFDDENESYWTYSKVAKLLNILKIRDEESNIFTDLKIRNLVFFWGLIQVQIDFTKPNQDAVITS